MELDGAPAIPAGLSLPSFWQCPFTKVYGKMAEEGL